MPNPIDRTGERYGRLVVICEAAERSKTGRRRWHCKCDCGNECVKTGTDMAPGRAQSCGCLHKQRTAETNSDRVKHGHSAGTRKGKRLTTPEYKSWKAMKERCRNESAPNYHLYGGRGITVCDRWLGDDGFINFLADMGARPEGSTLDRKDTNGNYEPSNCRWSTASEQAKNRRQTPEYVAKMKANLDAGRSRMWSDPELRERLLISRRK